MFVPKSGSTSPPVECKYKIITLGDDSAGKTSIIHSLMGIEFNLGQRSTSHYKNPYQQKVIIMSHKIDGKERKYCIFADLFDTFREEKFHDLYTSYYRHADCAIIVYDIADRKSFDRIKHWFDQCINQFCGSRISVAIVGNKTDLNDQRQVSRDEAIELCKSLRGDDEYFKIDMDDDVCTDRDRCQLLCDGYLRESESQLWSPSRSQYIFNFNLIPSIFAAFKASEYEYDKHSSFIPMDIYRLCFEFCFVEQKSTICYFETSAKTKDGINEMIVSLVRTRLEIDYYHPPQPVYIPEWGDWIQDKPAMKQPNGIWSVFRYVSDFASSYL